MTVLGLWRYDELIKELLLPDEGASEGDQEPVEIVAIDTSNLWRLAYLNVKVCLCDQKRSRFTTSNPVQLSVDSEVKLRMTQKWMKELHRNLELIVSAVQSQMINKTNEINNIRTELTETFEPLISLLKTSIVYLQRYYDGDWPGPSFCHDY
jgi:hypothetical protein